MNNQNTSVAFEILDFMIDTAVGVMIGLGACAILTPFVFVFCMMWQDL